MTKPILTRSLLIILATCAYGGAISYVPAWMIPLLFIAYVNTGLLILHYVK